MEKEGVGVGVGNTKVGVANEEGREEEDMEEDEDEEDDGREEELVERLGTCVRRTRLS